MLLLSVVDGKVSAVVAVTDDLTGRFSAANLIKQVTPAIGGQGGGGRPDFAQGGGADPAGAEQALEIVAQALAA